MPKNTTISTGHYLYSQEAPFKLVNGEYLTRLDLAYETYGKLNNEKNNVILVHHSLSMDAHASNYNQPDQSDKSGWWDCMIGDNKPLDTKKYFIICINNLGSCFGSSGPSNYNNFPLITIHDMVISQKLLLDYLGINKLKLIVGSSMGGMLSLAWLQLYPNSLENLFVAATSAKAYPVNIFNRMIQQEIIKINLDNSDNSKLTLKIARMLGYLYYRSTDELNNRFADINQSLNQTIANIAHNNANYIDGMYKNTELYNYFSYNAEKFVNNFDQKSYLCLLNAMDLYDLTQAGFNQHITYKNINITIAGINSDILFPLYQQQEIYDLLVKSGYQPKFIEHQSSYGHDAFLVEHEKFGGYISSLL